MSKLDALEAGAELLVGGALALAGLYGLYAGGLASVSAFSAPGLSLGVGGTLLHHAKGHLKK